MTEEEMTLIDRIDAIRKADQKYDLRNRAYLSFSGGKDSTILHHLLDIALPDNKIPRVFIDTGIEYVAIRKFVQSLAEKDPRIVMIKPSKPIKAVLEEYGYPFKSKEHSAILAQYQRNGTETRWVRTYLKMEGSKFLTCPASLRYQFSDGFGMKVSDQCCLRLKKEPAKKWAKENNRPITITGMRREEGGQRRSLGCVITDKRGKVAKFHPLAPVSEGWEDWIVKEHGIGLCELYGEPYNFERTGCKGCPFSRNLADQLTIMERYLPAERKQCEIIWKPVYDEYRRIGYRLEENEQLRLF